MFEIKLKDEIKKFTLRKDTIKKLDKIVITDKSYIDYISKYESETLNEDINLLDYQKAINSNSYISKNYPLISSKFWLIATSGQGDEWFIDIQNETIVFYNHNKGEYVDEGFISMNLSFEDFLKLGIIVKKLENYLEEDSDENSIKSSFINALNGIKEGLYSIYPYNYF